MKRNRTSINPSGTNVKQEIPPATVAQGGGTDNCKGKPCTMAARMRNLEEENMKILRKLEELVVNNDLKY